MNKMILVFINGHAGVGKDTFVRFCRQYAESQNCKVYNLHRSDAPKMALQTLGWNGDKDEETRSLLKTMVDYMESKNLLNKYLDSQIQAAKTINNKDSIIFYHVRDPEVMYKLMGAYIVKEGIKPISVLIKRNLSNSQEPDEWWGNVENADYTATIQLPDDDLTTTERLAWEFVDFLLGQDWYIRKGETE